MSVYISFLFFYYSFLPLIFLSPNCFDLSPVNLSPSILEVPSLCQERKFRRNSISTSRSRKCFDINSYGCKHATAKSRGFQRKETVCFITEKKSATDSVIWEKSLVLLGLMLPIHARCFASFDSRSKMHLRCDFRFIFVFFFFRKYLKKFRLSSCVALIANHVNLIKI